MALELMMTDGTKSVPLDELPESAWRYITGSSEGSGDLSPATAVQVVPILFRALRMRSDAIAALPWALYEGETDVKDAARYQSLTRGMRRRLRLTSGSLDVYGAGYWVKETNRFGRNVSPRWMLPSSLELVGEHNVTPEIRADVQPNDDGVYGFTRRTDRNEMFLAWDEVVYFWEPSLTGEIGPGPGCVRPALAAAGALNHMDRFVEAYFKRGVIKATVFQVEGEARKGDMEQLQSVLRSMLSGIRKAFSVLVLRNNFKPIVIGDSAKDTSAPELTTQRREDIAMAMGVPFSKLYSQAANFATAQIDDLSFMKDTVKPQAEMIEEALNEQLFEPLGLRFEFQFEKLEVFQAAELQKATAIMTVVGRPLLTVDEGRAALDYEPLPQEQEPQTQEAMLVADVESGVVTKNERRSRLGLEPAAEDVSETTRRQLLAQLAIVKAAKDAGLSAQEGIALALGDPLESLQQEEEEHLDEGLPAPPPGGAIMPPAVTELPASDGARPQAPDATEPSAEQEDSGKEDDAAGAAKAILQELRAARLELQRMRGV